MPTTMGSVRVKPSSRRRRRIGRLQDIRFLLRGRCERRGERERDGIRADAIPSGVNPKRSGAASAGLDHDQPVVVKVWLAAAVPVQFVVAVVVAGVVNLA